MAARIDRERLEEFGLRRLEPLGAPRRAVKRDNDIGARRPYDGVDMGRIELERLFEQVLRSDECSRGGLC